MRPTFDEKDEAIKQQNLKAFDKEPWARVGDFVIFTCGTIRRISYILPAGDNLREYSIQTSNEGGGYYFGEGYISFSGQLFGSVKGKTLRMLQEKKDGNVWFFHHNFAEAHNGVNTTIPCRIFTCSEKAPI